MERILQIFQGGQTRGIKSSKETLDFLAIRLGASLISIQEGTAAGTLDLGGAALKNIGGGSVPTDAATIGQLTGALTSKIDVSQRGIANGLASLDGNGLLPISQIPPLAVVNTYTVSSQ